MKHLKHSKIFIYYTKYKSSLVILNNNITCYLLKILFEGIFSTLENVFQRWHYTTTSTHIRLYYIEWMLAKYNLFYL